ncbi:bifunctional DNA primase/helicase [Sphingomonas koreensis]|uniref:bifunctional DNA primase/helicase n=1 Tax=Sphingomonas koreensis TaxID=93064 RepID=UPI00234F95D4|nr:bifunctional DNA primase/helicase [Sphingomonas koreensis]MDC7808811.1 bifunctional DNA primase/helicase [Sphingomonas koreensis]
MSLDTNLDDRIRDRLKRDFKFRKEARGWLREGQCPECHRWEFFVRSEKPRVVRCGRLNSCGHEAHVRDLYPDFFESWSDRVTTTSEDPNAAADAYLLHDRGFDLKDLRGHYSQQEYHDRRRKLTSATVRFPLQTQPGAYWERLIDRPDRFDRKANFSPVEDRNGNIIGPSYKGHAWLTPGHTIEHYAQAYEIWFTEGVFNTIAMEQGDFRAARDPDHPIHKAQPPADQEAFEFAEAVEGGAEVAPVQILYSAALLSSGNYPSEFLKLLRIAIAAGPTPTKRPRLVFALDNGKAGVEAIGDMVKQAREEGWEAEAALPRLDDDPGRDADWNDLFRMGKLGHKAREDYLWHGAVAIAPDEREKAFLLWQRRRWSGFSFVFNYRTWWARCPSQAEIASVIKEGFPDDPKLSAADFDVKEEAVARRLMSVELIANCTFRALYFERNEATDTSAYWLRVDRPGKLPRIKASFPGPAVAGSGEFKKRLVSVASGAIWTGDQYHLDRIMQRQLPVRDVIGIEFTGYTKEHKIYVYSDFAVAQGKVYRPNADGFFEIGKVAIKLRTTERVLDRLEYDPDHLDLSWLAEVWAAWGPKGIVVVTFWLCALHAEQIRRFNASLGFLEIYGQPGSGKSTLLEFMWKTLGREGYEGFDPAKATQPGISRELAKVGNLPVVFIEGDRKEDNPRANKFDWDETKTLYNGRATRTRGVQNQGLETYSPPFRGGFVIAQNEPVAASRAVMERIMSITIDKSEWTDETRAAALKIEAWSIEQVSGFLIHAVRHEPKIMDRFVDRFPVHEAELLGTPGVSNVRLAKTHGQLLAMLDCLDLIFPGFRPEWKKATAAFIRDMAIVRHKSVSTEHAHIETFWDHYELLEERFTKLNHARGDGLIAIRLGEFEAACGDARLRLPCPVSELRKLLKQSKRHPFVAAKPVNSVHPDIGTVQCWVFQDSRHKPASAKETGK